MDDVFPYLKLPIFLFFILFVINIVSASIGDASPEHETCLNYCIILNCSNPDAIEDFYKQQPYSHWLTKWDCNDECRYNCMWEVVQWFMLKNESVPQFYGKWPFFRLLGIQEPASTLFSILNGIVHFMQLQKFRKSVPNSAPYYNVHFIYALVSVNAWIWSTVFHTRDTRFTEMMDYFSAQFAVMFSTYILIVRILGVYPVWRAAAIGIVCVAFYIQHIYYLAFIHFDYSYNMTVAVTLGMSNMIGWIFWSMWCWTVLPHVWKCAVAMIILNFLLILELIDFPPIWFIFDAHSLWHCGTIPLPFIWYSFTIDDCLYLHKRKKGKYEDVKNL